MNDDVRVNVTEVLAAVREGDRAALDQLLPLVYDELRARARSYMRMERSSHTLQPTALVHEAYMRLVSQQNIDWECRAHFFAAASQIMRRILVDHARARGRTKRGDGAVQVTLDDSITPSDAQNYDVLALHEVLERLEAIDERQARVVELRFFGGMSIDEVAVVLGISPRTVNGEWLHAKAWLTLELTRSTDSD